MDWFLNYLYNVLFGWMGPYHVDAIMIVIVVFMLILGIRVWGFWPWQCGVRITGAAGCLAIANFIRMFIVEAGATAGRIAMTVGSAAAMYLLVKAKSAPEGWRLRKSIAWTFNAPLLIAFAFGTLLAMPMLTPDDNHINTTWIVLRFASPTFLWLAALMSSIGFIVGLFTRASSRP